MHRTSNLTHLIRLKFILTPGNLGIILILGYLGK